MTNEEAKERIQALYNDWLPVEYDFEVFDTEENKLDREAFALAIEALKAKSEIENSKSEIKNAKTEISMSKSKMTNEEAITILKREFSECKDTISVYAKKRKKAFDMAIKALEQTRWIPVSERLPRELETVNITWINHNPESYYADIKDKPFTATAVYFNGQWYWWSTFCTDTLAEYSHNYNDIIDDDIEITAWMPLPQPYKAESKDEK